MARKNAVVRRKRASEKLKHRNVHVISLDEDLRNFVKERLYELGQASTGKLNKALVYYRTHKGNGFTIAVPHKGTHGKTRYYTLTLTEDGQIREYVYSSAPHSAKDYPIFKKPYAKRIHDATTFLKEYPFIADIYAQHSNVLPPEKAERMQKFIEPIKILASANDVFRSPEALSPEQKSLLRQAKAVEIPSKQVVWKALARQTGKNLPPFSAIVSPPADFVKKAQAELFMRLNQEFSPETIFSILIDGMSFKVINFPTITNRDQFKKVEENAEIVNNTQVDREFSGVLYDKERAYIMPDKAFADEYMLDAFEGLKEYLNKKYGENTITEKEGIITMPVSLWQSQIKPTLKQFKAVASNKGFDYLFKMVETRTEERETTKISPADVPVQKLGAIKDNEGREKRFPLVLDKVIILHKKYDGEIVPRIFNIPTDDEERKEVLTTLANQHKNDVFVFSYSSNNPEYSYLKSYSFYKAKKGEFIAEKRGRQILPIYTRTGTSLTEVMYKAYKEYEAIKETRAKGRK